MNKINNKNLVLYIIVPAIAAVIGTLVTLIFAPTMENIRFSFWKKQRNEEIKFILFEKRLDNIVEFQNANVQLRRCLDKYTKPEYRETTNYIYKYCTNELDQMWTATFKATVIFNEEAVNQINILRESIGALVMKSLLNIQDPDLYVNAVLSNLDKSLELLHKNLNEY
jgi:Na+-translocating ferredoxin:NAD+ oxidoreductase RnfG subunit